MKTRTGRRFGVTALLVCLLAFAAGCGGGNKNNDNNGAAGTTTAADTGGVAEATKFVADHLANPTKVPLGDTPLSKAPPKGKSVVFLECGVPNCKNVGNGIAEATKALGWKFTRIPAGLTPESVVKAWQTAITLKPDAAMIAGFGSDVAAKQIDEFTANGAPWVGESVTDEVGQHGLLANIATPADFALRGQWLARWMVADTKGKVNAILFNSPAFAILKGYRSPCRTSSRSFVRTAS